MITHAYEALLRLLMAGGALAPRRALLQAAGGAQAAIAQGPANWRAHGCTPEQCAALERPDARVCAAALRWLEQDNHHLLPCTDPAARPKKQARDVFVYFIHEGKVRAPAAAMALIERLGTGVDRKAAVRR